MLFKRHASGFLNFTTELSTKPYAMLAVYLIPSDKKKSCRKFSIEKESSMLQLEISKILDTFYLVRAIPLTFN